MPSKMVSKTESATDGAVSDTSGNTSPNIAAKASPRPLLKNAVWLMLAVVVFLGAFAVVQRVREYRQLALLATNAQQLRVVVTEFYQTHGRLPQAWDAEALGKTAGLWPRMTVVAPGVLRHELPHDARAVYQVFTESKSAQFGLDTRCVVSDVSLEKRVALSRLECAQEPVWLAQLGAASSTAAAAAPPAVVGAPAAPASAPAIPQALFEHYFDAGRAQRIANCLAPWPLKWRLPYFPNLVTGHCDTQAASGPGGIRKTTLGLSHQPNWFVAQRARDNGRFASASAMAAHFDALLTEQGFTRSPTVTSEEPDEDMPPNAVYTRGNAANALRIHLRYALDKTVLSIEGVEPTPAGTATAPKTPAPPAAAAALVGAQLPRPAAMHSLYESGYFGPWFALPGLKLTQEGLGGGNAHIVALSKIDTRRFITPDWQDVQRSHDADPEEKLYLFEFTHRLQYTPQPTIPRAEFVAAYRLALVSAGWTLGAERPSDGGDELRAHFKFADRAVTAVIRLFDDTVMVDVHDPTFVEHVYVVGNSITQRQGYNFTPQLRGNPKAVEQTRLQLDVMNLYLRSELGSTPANKHNGVLLRPALVQGLEKDPAKLAQAKAMAQSLVAEFKQRGWADDRIRVIDERNSTPIHPYGPFTHGVRVSTYNCNTSESSGAAGEQNCVCRSGSPEVIGATPGACK